MNSLQVVLARLETLEATLERTLAAVEKSARRPGLPDQEWFSIEETAALTGLSQDHVRRHVTTGMLVASNQGTFEKPYYRIHRSDIDAWMARRKETPGPAPRKGRKPGSYASRHHSAPA